MIITNKWQFHPKTNCFMIHIVLYSITWTTFPHRIHWSLQLCQQYFSSRFRFEKEKISDKAELFAQCAQLQSWKNNLFCAQHIATRIASTSYFYRCKPRTYTITRSTTLLKPDAATLSVIDRRKSVVTFSSCNCTRRWPVLRPRERVKKRCDLAIRS